MYIFFKKIITTDTTHYGNVLKGWDSYLTKKESGSMKKKSVISDDDRLFSKSSYTSFLDGAYPEGSDLPGGSHEQRYSHHSHHSHHHKTAKPAKKKKVSIDENSHQARF